MNFLNLSKALTILTAAAVTSFADGQSSRFSDPELTSQKSWISSGPGKRIIDVMNAPATGFQKKLELSISKAIGESNGDLINMKDSASPSIGWNSNVEVFIRGGFDGSYTLSSPIVVNMFEKQGFILRSEPSVFLEFTGRGTALTFLQAAGMKLENINVRLKGSSPQQVGIKFRHNARWNHLYHCRVEMEDLPGKTDCVGIMFEGDAQMGVSGADISTNTLEQCQVWLKGDLPINTEFTGDHLAGYAAKRNVGFAFLGSDLMANTIKECTVHNMAVGYSHAKGVNAVLTSSPSPNSGNGLNTYMNSSANYCYVGWHFPGFANTTMVGGRSENNGCYVLQGPEGTTSADVSDEDGVLCLTGVEFGGIRQIGAMSCPAMFFSGKMIDFRTSGSIAAIGSSFTLESTDSALDVFRLASSSKILKKRASLTLQGCRHICKASGEMVSSPASWNNNANWQAGNPTGWVVDRQWSVWVDGVMRQLGVMP